MGSTSLLVILFLFHLGNAAGLDLWAYECSDSRNYTKSSQKVNIEQVLTYITTTDIPYGFYNFSVGKDPDQTNAIALCRGDINVSDCHACLEFVLSNLTVLCPVQMDAVGWAEKCMLRYSSKSILGGLWLDNPNYNLVSGVDVATDVDHFAKVVEDLLSTLPNKTAGGDSRLKFATGEAKLNATSDVYALMQCTPDLTPNDCLGCLYWAMYYALQADKGQTGARVLLPSCWVRYDLNKFYVSPPPKAGKASATSSAAARSGEGSDKFKMVIIVVLSVGACLSLLLNLFMCCFLKRRAVHSNILSKLDNVEEARRIGSLQMNFNTIRVATQTFSAEKLLGRGGFGVVYKGTLNSGEQIAVKRLASSSKQSEEEFVNEVHLAAKLQHRNLVKLLGFCLEGEERLLIFEFVSNGSLDQILFDEEKRVQLDWQTRFIIIEGIARGLLYLHEDSRYKIVHRDLKPANVLLDEDFRPKITDFGTARLFPPNVTHANTERAAGTKAYMAPEYFRQGLFSVKSDVYSFGIMVLEIVAGRRNIIFTDFPSEETGEILVNMAWRDWSNRTVPNIIDPTIASVCSVSQVTRCIHIAFLCLQESPESRPTISSLNKMLASESSELPYPSQLAFMQNGTKLQMEVDALIKSNSVISLGSSTDLDPR